jgi:hypothetical protein
VGGLDVAVEVVVAVVAAGVEVVASRVSRRR